MHDFLLLDAVAQANAIRRREVSALEMTDAYLARIDRIDGELRAFVTVDRDGARRAARAIDDGDVDAPLAGVTFSIKDVTDVAGLPTTHSCDLLADNVATEDGPVARRFRDAGLVLLGKTNVPEFCTSMTSSRLNGVCRNPWDTERTPGGSSGGAAAAVAAGLCAAAHGTDGAGSVRVPAAYCGLVGVKPTRGLVAFGPMEGSAYFQTSVPGVLSRSVRDAAALLDALAAPGPWTPTRPRAFADEIVEPPSRLRIGVCVTPPYGAVDDEVVDATHTVGRVLESLGHHVEAALPSWEALKPARGGAMNVPGPAALVDVADADRVEPRNVEMIRQLAALTVLDHARWVDAARSATRRFVRLWDDYDVLVTPATGLLQPLLDWVPWDLPPDVHGTRLADFPAFVAPFNLTGQPALSVPATTSALGLPIGVQLVGRHLEEALLLRLAAQLEEANPWADRLRRVTEAVDGRTVSPG